MTYDIYRCLFVRRVPRPVMIPIHEVQGYNPHTGDYVYMVPIYLNDVAPIINEKDNCPICLDDIDTVRITQCNHRFCDSCLSTWIQKSRRCPLCNQDLIELVNSAQSM